MKCNALKATFMVVVIAYFALAAYGACAPYTDCPLDGAQSLLVDTEYQGIVAIGVYEHTTSTGQKHRFRQRCK
jgi:hypothetical protein